MELKIYLITIVNFCLIASSTSKIYEVTLMNLLHEEQFKTLQSCSSHDECSCVGGLAVCYGGCCHCIHSRFKCGKNIDCTDACPSNRTMCMFDRCHCVTEHAAQLLSLEYTDGNDTLSQIDNILSHLPQYAQKVPETIIPYLLQPDVKNESKKDSDFLDTK